MLNDFKLYNVHAESSEIEMWSILNTKIDYVEYIREEQPLNRVKFNPMEGKYQKGYRQLLGESKPCQEVSFESMTENLQAYYLYRYKGIQVQIHQVSQFDDYTTVSTTYLGRTDRSKKNVIKLKSNFQLQISLQQIVLY